jgi:uncharacterized protein (TIGR03437 family)
MKTYMLPLHYMLAVFACASVSYAQAVVVNGATFAVGVPVGQGSLATVFGAFTGVTQGQAQSVPWPKTINNVRVVIDNNIEAPLQFVGPTQVNFQVPRSLGFGRHSIKVSAGAAEIAGTIDILDTAPGVFIRDERQGIRRQAAVLNQDNTINGPANRARKGQVIQIFSTGVGPVSGNTADGAAGPSAPLASMARPPKVYVSVAPADVQFAGLSPQFPGVWQINAVVPDRDYVAGEVPLVIVSSGVESNTATIWVE